MLVYRGCRLAAGAPLAGGRLVPLPMMLDVLLNGTIKAASGCSRDEMYL